MRLGPLSARQARLLHLEAQGLRAPPPRRATRAALLRAIERMQLLQIDTIHVVARSPYLVLFSRLGAYPPIWLDELLEAGAIFECWAHEACFAPAGDYGLHRRHQLERTGHWAMRSALRVEQGQRRAMDALLDRIREQGPLKAADFGGQRRGPGGWWGWKDEKRWLEAWFALGELMVTRRENFHRVYDLRERVLSKVSPGWRAEDLPSSEQTHRTLIERSALALGVAQARWLGDYFRVRVKQRDADLADLVRAGILLPVEVEGWRAPGYVHARLLGRAKAIAAGRAEASYTTLLSPFDPVVWDRGRAAEMFGFDYRLECYTPEAKRRYGYYVLPILDRGELIGRLDAKAHRGDGVFEVKAIYLEPRVAPGVAVAARVAEALARCAQWHRTPRVVVRRSDPRSFAKMVRSALDRSDRPRP